uniref:Uncharacterized protein n=1 Tax=Glossina palpalis gambiensis TaxID=67801 RepID=A0A1B0ATZ6_9MUSC
MRMKSSSNNTRKLYNNNLALEETNCVALYVGTNERLVTTATAWVKKTSNEKRKRFFFIHNCNNLYNILDSIVVSIPACHAGDRGSIPRRGVFTLLIASNFFKFEGHFGFNCDFLKPMSSYMSLSNDYLEEQFKSITFSFRPYVNINDGTCPDVQCSLKITIYAKKAQCKNLFRL